MRNDALMHREGLKGFSQRSVTVLLACSICAVSRHLSPVHDLSIRDVTSGFCQDVGFSHGAKK